MKIHFLISISLVAVGILASIMFFWHLGTNPLEKWDEAIHAQVTHEMVESGNWLELTWNHEPYFRKPPLRFWLSAPVVMFFGESEFTIRFWSATAGVLTTLLIALWAWQAQHQSLRSDAGQATKKISTAWLAALIFLSGKYLFYHAFRTGETDGLMTFTTLLALWAYWKSWTKPRWLIVTALALGLTFLTKFTAAGFAGITILLHLVATRGFTKYSKKIWLQTIGIGLLVVAPWVVAQLVIRGNAFVQEYFSEDIVTRASTNLYGFEAGPGWYWDVFVKRFFPLAAFALPACVWAIGRMIAKRDSLLGLWLAFLAVTVAIVSFNASKTDWYLLPIYPVLALVMSLWVTRWFRWPLGWISLGLIAWGVVAYVRRLPSMVPDTGFTHWLVPQTYLEWFNGNGGRWAMALLIAGVIILLTIMANHRQSPKLWRSTLVALLLWIGVIAFAGQRAELRVTRSEPLLPAARTIIQREKPNILYLKNVYLPHEPTVVFYLGNEKNTTLEDVPTSISSGAYVLEKLQGGVTPLGGTPLLQSADFQLVRYNQ